MTDSKKTLKQRYLQAQGRTISLDYFLFTCKEEEDTILGTKFLYVKGKGFPNKENAPQKDTTISIEESVDAICTWYKTTYPQLASNDVLDYQTHGALVQLFVLLKLDIDKVLKHSFERIPAPTNNTENKKPWDVIDHHFKRAFPSYSDFLIKYLDWHYQETQKKVYDFKSIPPVGRFIGLLKRHFGYQAFAPEREPSYQTRSTHRHSRDNRETGSSPSHKRHRSSTPSSFSRNTDRHETRSSSSKQEEASALQEVQQALKKFETNPSLKVVTLKAQNSYIRRMQHKKISESEFVSNSVGEGPNRALQIKRL